MPFSLANKKMYKANLFYFYEFDISEYIFNISLKLNQDYLMENTFKIKIICLSR